MMARVAECRIEITADQVNGDKLQVIEGHPEPSEATPLVSLGCWVINLDPLDAARTKPQGPTVVSGTDNDDLMHTPSDGRSRLVVEELGPSGDTR
jgi:hypothetical protein